MKKNVMLGSSLLVVALVGLTAFTTKGEAVSQAPDYVTMYRLYNPNSGEHFYTADAGEKASLLQAGWQDENIGWYAPKTGQEVYRLLNPNTGDHHYTMSGEERTYLVGQGWRYEGVGWYSDFSQSVPLYRAFNPNVSVGSHHYTVSQSEQSNLASIGWVAEGVAWYGVQVNDGSNGGGTTTPTEPSEPEKPVEPKPEKQTPVIRAKKELEVTPFETYSVSQLFEGATGENGEQLALYQDVAVSSSEVVITGDYTAEKKVTFSYKDLSVTSTFKIVDRRPERFNNALFQKTFYDLVNQHRISNGKLALASYDADILQQISDVRAKELGTIMDHNRPNGQSVYDIIPSTPYNNSYSEIIYGQANNDLNSEEISLANQAFNRFKNSSLHNSIMLRGNSSQTNMRLSVSVHFKSNYDTSFAGYNNAVYVCGLVGDAN